MEQFRQVYLSMTWAMYDLLCLNANIDHPTFKQYLQTVDRSLTDFNMQQIIDTCEHVAFCAHDGLKPGEVYDFIDGSINNIFDKVFYGENFADVKQQLRDIYEGV